MSGTLEFLSNDSSREPEARDSNDHPDWTAPLFRYPSEISRQVLRFFKNGSLK